MGPNKTIAQGFKRKEGHRKVLKNFINTYNIKNDIFDPQNGSDER